MSQIELKNLFIQIISQVGIKSKVIANKTGISQSDLSRFKNGHICLCLRDSQNLEDYLNTFKNML